MAMDIQPQDMEIQVRTSYFENVTEGNYEGDTVQRWNANEKQWEIVRQGIGKIRFEDGSWFDGDWYDNKPHGQGIFENKQEKTKYEGAFRNGLKHGKGKQRQPDSTLIDAVWREGTLHGEGSILHLSGKVEMSRWMYGQRVDFDGHLQEGTKVDYDYYMNKVMNACVLFAGLGSLFAKDESTRRSLRYAAGCLYACQWLETFSSCTWGYLNNTVKKQDAVS